MIGVDTQTGEKLGTPFFRNSVVCIWGVPFFFLFLLFSFCFPGIPVFGGVLPSLISFDPGQIVNHGS